jgi:rsbT antagonist protein RsbS
MQPAVAITLVELGLTLSGVRTALDVDRGLAMLAGRQHGSLAEADDDDQLQS